ncbi:MAG: hypothetical protein WAW88_06370 [Nocardioides sp.]
MRGTFVMAAGLALVAATGCAGQPEKPQVDRPSAQSDAASSPDPRLEIEPPSPPAIDGTVGRRDAVKFAAFVIGEEYPYALRSGWIDTLGRHWACFTEPLCANAEASIEGYRSDDLIVTVGDIRIVKPRLVRVTKSPQTWDVRMTWLANEVVITDSAGVEVARQDETRATVLVRVAERGLNVLGVVDVWVDGEIPGLEADGQPLGELEPS